MIAGKFDPQQFFHRTENVALHVPASELFGLLKRTLDLPSQWAALVARTTGDYELIRPGGSVGDGGAQSVMFIRVTPVDVNFDESDLLSRDGFTCKAEVRARLSVIPERGELLSFQKHLLGSRRVAQAEGLASYLQPSLRAALARFAAEHDAAALVDARISEAVSSALADALEPACFAAGLMLERHPTGRFESSSLRQVQQVQRTAAARRAEHEAARQLDDALQKARSEHVDQLASLLTRLNELAAASPDVKLPDLLRTFSERQRGQLYEALFATEKPATQTQWIVVAAAEELFFFDPAALGAPSRRLKVDGPAGHARSVQTARACEATPLP
ncbi:MAG: SPFH domain-containing protein, partial [Planctomycetota bacterium]